MGCTCTQSPTLTEQWASSEETSNNASLQWKTLRTRQWCDLSWSVHYQSGIPIHRPISSPWSRCFVHVVSNDYKSRTPGCVTKMLDDPLEDRHRLDRLSMLYRMQLRMVWWIYPQTDTWVSMTAAKFFQDKIADTTYSNSFFPKTARVWNRLPSKVVPAASLEEFRSHLQATKHH